MLKHNGTTLEAGFSERSTPSTSFNVTQLSAKNTVASVQKTIRKLGQKKNTITTWKVIKPNDQAKKTNNKTIKTLKAARMDGKNLSLKKQITDAHTAPVAMTAAPTAYNVSARCG